MTGSLHDRTDRLVSDRTLITDNTSSSDACWCVCVWGGGDLILILIVYRLINFENDNFRVRVYLYA